MGEQKKMLDTFKKLIETCTLIGDNPELFGMGEDEEDFMMTDGILNNGGDDELDELSKYNAGQRH